MNENLPKMNVLIPAAGRGVRFANAGYTFPKPLIDVDGMPMIEAVVRNINMPQARHIFIVQSDQNIQYNMSDLLYRLADDVVVITIDGVTEGAACTVLEAIDHIDNLAPLLIANSDQLVKFSSENFAIVREWTGCDAIIFTFKARHPKWSFVAIDDEIYEDGTGKPGRITEVAEKKPISDNATCGLYYVSHGSDFVWAAQRMIERDIRTNNEFYVAPAFNEMIDDGKVILPFFVDEMHGLGTPEDLQAYLSRQMKR